MNEPRPKDMPLDLVVYGQDDSKFCDFRDRPEAADPDAVKWIEAVVSVYLIDRSQRTNCCEATPSYWLEPLYISVYCKPNCPDELREKLQDMYENPSDDEGCYIHCHDVDRVIAAGGPLVHVRESKELVGDDETYEQAFESWREHYCGNHAV